MIRRMRRPLALGAIAAIGLAACGSSGHDAAKAGAPSGPTVLRLAGGGRGLSLFPTVQDFVNAVQRRSHGRVRIEVVGAYGADAPDAEQQVVRGVAARKVDLGYVRTGVFDFFGVKSLQALTAPMLITSYGVEAAVVRSDMPKRMLAGVDRAGVVGLAVLADQMRRPFGVARALLGPDDYRGVTVAAYPSRGTDAALAALGARPVSLTGEPLMQGLRSGRVGAFERTLRVYGGGGIAGSAPYATANVNLWPQMLALIASPAALKRLSAPERRWLGQAAADATTKSIAIARTDDRWIAEACRTGSRFTNASAAQIAALRTRFEPLYAALEQDPQTRSYIARIRALAASTPADPPPVIPTGCTGRPPARVDLVAAAGRLDGTYRWTLTTADHKHDPFYDPSEAPGGADVFTMRLDKGRWALHGALGDGSSEEDHGIFQVRGDRAVFSWQSPGETDVFRFRLAGDRLALRLLSGDRGDGFVWGFKTWRKIG